MSKRNKLLLTVAAAVAGLLVLLVVSSVLIFQSAWFANFVKEKIIATAEQSTGGKAELGSFQFDWSRLTVRIRNFVLHGTESKNVDPLLHVDLLELHLRLFSGIAHTVDLAYVGIQKPVLSVIVFPDGTTNIPQPKVKTKSSNTNSLETVVDLKIGEFSLQNGLLEYSQQKSAFSGRGQNLHALLNYNTLNPSYSGSLAIDPLLLTSGSRPPLRVHVNVPVSIDKSTIRIAGASLATDLSKIGLDASLQNLNAPVIDASLNGKLSLVEIQRSIDLGIDPEAKGAPKELTIEARVHTDDKSNALQVQTAHLALGDTTFQASGSLRDSSNPSAAANFNSNLALDQLGRLFKVTSPQLTGALVANGVARLDNQSNYRVDGTINSHAVSLKSGDTSLRNVALYSPFHVDPYLISLDGLRLQALGGSLAAKLFLEKLQNLSVEGHLQNFSLPGIMAFLTGKRVAYDGTINGVIKARGDLAAKGTSGYSANTQLNISPGAHGVPVRGQVNANYNGPTGAVGLANSYLALPNSRIDLSGTLNSHLDLHLVSHDLNDFLPAANFGSAAPLKSLPVTLQGGAASVQAQVKGNLSNPQISGHIAMDRFALQGRSFDNFGLDLTASPSDVQVRNGLLTRGALRTAIDASLGLRKWSPTPASPVTANITLRNATLPDLLSLAGESSIPASGDTTADVHVNGTYGNPLGSAILRVSNGVAYDQPFNRLYANVDLADQLVTLAPLELSSDAGTITGTARFQHPRDSFTVGTAQMHIGTTVVQLANVKPLQARSPGAAGAVQLIADAAGALHQVKGQTAFDLSNITADFSAHSLRVSNQDAGDLTATARTANNAVTYQVASNFAGSNVSVNGRTLLTADYATDAKASIQHLPIAKVLSITGQTAVPATGDFSADAQLSGTIKRPNADLSFNLAKANVYTEPIDSFRGKIRYANNLVDLPGIELNTPAGNMTLAGSFRHPDGNFSEGALNLTLKTNEIQLAKIQHVRQAEPTLNGTLHVAADLAGNLRQQNGKAAMLFSSLNADASTNGLMINQLDLGGASLNAKTSGTRLNFRLDSDIAKSQIHGVGHSELSGDYPIQADLSFSNVKYSNIAPFLPSQAGTPPAYEALVEGKASVSGPAFDTDRLNARLELTRLLAQTSSTTSSTGAPPGRAVTIQNDGPVVIALNHDVVDVQQFHLKGPSTAFNVAGRVNLNNDTAPLSLNVDGNVNLGVLQDIDRNFYSSGALTLNAAVHGTFAQPLLNGQMLLKNASVNYATAPNGLSNANGVILLNGSGATIQNLTAESGGGRITVTGFAGLNAGTVAYDIQAAANRVRVRYSGISVTSSTTISLAGNSRHSLLSGNVRVQRIAYNSSSDAGSLLSQFASKPPTTPSAPSGLLTGMRLEIQISTAPDLRVSTTYANRLSVEASLTVRGTADSPGMTGRVVVTDGQLVFFGNSYTVNTGTVNFYNPNSIQPVLNVSLETLAQGVDVTLGVAGSMENLNLTYRSDPPLTFEQIVELLATNTTPNDPNIVANQPPTAQQSYTQMGESAILGQAVANPLASRVQRVFGLSQFKIDPSVAGTNGQPTARVTLQQKIFNNVTFTYITDVTQTNSEIVRVEWDLTPKFSAVGLRDYNGNVSLEFFYNFGVR